jgi:hypothetical protein
MTMQPTHSSRRILLPVKQWFILFSLAAAFFLNLIPLGHLPSACPTGWRWCWPSGACANRCASAWARPSCSGC